MVYSIIILNRIPDFKQNSWFLADTGMPVVFTYVLSFILADIISICTVCWNNCLYYVRSPSVVWTLSLWDALLEYRCSSHSWRDLILTFVPTYNTFIWTVRFHSYISTNKYVLRFKWNRWFDVITTLIHCLIENHFYVVKLVLFKYFLCFFFHNFY